MPPVGLPDELVIAHSIARTKAPRIFLRDACFSLAASTNYALRRVSEHQNGPTFVFAKFWLRVKPLVEVHLVVNLAKVFQVIAREAVRRDDGIKRCAASERTRGSRQVQRLSVIPEHAIEDWQVAFHAAHEMRRPIIDINLYIVSNRTMP